MGQLAKKLGWKEKWMDNRSLPESGNLSIYRYAALHRVKNENVALAPHHAWRAIPVRHYLPVQAANRFSPSGVANEAAGRGEVGQPQYARKDAAWPKLRVQAPAVRKFFVY
jgi:hypothetical protein